jgi:hypothetical protein
MSRVFISEGTGAGVYVFSDDHCPPHVHARHRGDGWVARVRFSYVDDAVAVLSLTPLKDAPLQRVINRLLADIQAGLPACRRSWWVTRQTTCLGNLWAATVGAGPMRLASGPGPHLLQIASAIYEPEPERLRVTFHDGATTDVRLRK